MGRFYAADQRGEMQLGVVERYSVFHFANNGALGPQGLGSLRVLNAYHLAPGAKLEQQWFEPFGLCVMNLQGCYTHKTSQGKFANLVGGQGFMLWTDDELELEVINPSPYEELIFLQLWFDLTKGFSTDDAVEQLFHLPEMDHQYNTWIAVPVAEGLAAQNRFDVQIKLQQVTVGHAFQYQLATQSDGWLYLLHGHLHINDQPMFSGDSFALDLAESFKVDGSQGALLLLIEHHQAA